MEADNLTQQALNGSARELMKAALKSKIKFGWGPPISALVLYAITTNGGDSDNSSSVAIVIFIVLVAAYVYNEYSENKKIDEMDDQTLQILYGNITVRDNIRYAINYLIIKLLMVLGGVIALLYLIVDKVKGIVLPKI